MGAIKQNTRIGVKICGLRDAGLIDVAIDAGATWIGLVHYPPSPRHVELSLARQLAAHIRGRAELVILTVDADDKLVDAIVSNCRPDWLQLHGQETPERVNALRRRDPKIMKAIKLADAQDLAAAQAYVPVSDMLLFDAKVDETASGMLPGGNGINFDWRLLQGQADARPFMLSGGLRSDNVAEAIKVARPAHVDVSSGVESRPGEKDPNLIRAFMAAVGATAVPHAVSRPRKRVDGEQ